jgi:N-acetylglutamate synthase-like GNAT family acetyltransferase
MTRDRHTSSVTIAFMKVRRARGEDASAIERLYRLLVPGDDNIRVDARRLAELESHPTNHLLVVDDAGGVVRGTAFLTICLDPMYGFLPYGVVENVVVDPPARGSGGGRMLLEAIEAAARAARCTKLMLLSSLSRTDAHGFFIRLGFDGDKKRGFVRYLNRPAALPSSA